MVLNIKNLNNWGTVTDKCVLWLNFKNIVSNTLYDSSGKGHNATLTGTFDTKAMKNGNTARYFNDAQGTITAHSDFNLGTNDFTFFTLCRLNSTQTNYAMFMTQQPGSDAFQFNVLSSNLLTVYSVDIGSHLTLGSRIIADDTWKTIAITRSGTSLKSYVNGGLDGSTTISSTAAFSDSTNNIKILRLQSGYYPLSGHMSILSLFNGIALSKTQIAALHRATFVE